MYNIIIKNIANILIDKKKGIFLVKYEPHDLTTESIQKILNIYKQFVGSQPVIFINDMRNVSIKSKEVKDFIREAIKDLNIKALLIVIENSFQRKVYNFLSSFNGFLPTSNNIRFFSTIEEAMARARQGIFTQALN